MAVNQKLKNENSVSRGVAGATFYGKGNGKVINIDMCLTFPFVAAVNSAVTARSRAVSSSNLVFSTATSVSG